MQNHRTRITRISLILTEDFLMKSVLIRVIRRIRVLYFFNRKTKTCADGSSFAYRVEAS